MVREGIEEADPCVECLELLCLGSLRNVLHLPIPHDHNLKYTLKECLGKLIGKLHATHLGLCKIMESPVCTFFMQICGVSDFPEIG